MTLPARTGKDDGTRAAGNPATPPSGAGGFASLPYGSFAHRTRRTYADVRRSTVVCSIAVSVDVNAAGRQPVAFTLDAFCGRRANGRLCPLSRLLVLKESQEKRCEHEHDANVHQQSFPESVLEEEHVHTDDNGYQ